MNTLSSARSAKSGRLVSLDVLRGFAMFWIIGGGTFVLASIHYLAAFLQGQGYFNAGPWMPLIELHTKHVGWEGLVAWDLIMPTFVFVSGATMPFALTGKLERGANKWDLHARLFWRMLVLVALGMSVHFFRLDFADMRPFSVLGTDRGRLFIGGSSSLTGASAASSPG